jgi:hypothetical protein
VIYYSLRCDNIKRCKEDNRIKSFAVHDIKSLGSEVVNESRIGFEERKK